MKKQNVVILIIFLVLFIAQVSSATTQFTGVSSQAMGGAGRAAVQASEAALLNPASLMFVRGYNMASSYRDFQTKDEGSTRNVLFHLSENETDSMFPLGITYLKTRDINSDFYGERQDLHFTTGQMLLKNLALGIDVAKYSITPENGAKKSEWDAKLGFLFVPDNNLGLGLVFTNLLVTDSPYLKRGVEAGVNYLFKEFLRVAVDVAYQMEDNPTDESVVMFGMEHMYLGQIPLRFGFKYDGPSSENYWTMGLGWNAPRIGFAYTFEKNVSEVNEYGHSVDLRIYF